MNRFSSLSLGLAFTLALSTSAFADASLTLPQGKLAMSVAVQTDGEATGLAPDLAIGATDRLTVAIVHSTQNATGFWSGAGTGSFCIAGEACGDLYTGGALLGKFALASSDRFAVAALGGVIHNLAAERSGLGAGVEALVLAGKVGVHFKPTIYIGLDDRDAAMPNTEYVNAPLSLLVAATKQLQLGVQSGVAGPVDGFAEAYRIPVGAMGSYSFGPGMNAQLAVNLDRVAGGNEMASMTDARSVTLTLGWVK
jgi:hypothetical protein